MADLDNGRLFDGGVADDLALICREAEVDPETQSPLAELRGPPGTCNSEGVGLGVAPCEPGAGMCEVEIDEAAIEGMAPKRTASPGGNSVAARTLSA